MLEKIIDKIVHFYYLIVFKVDIFVIKQQNKLKESKFWIPIALSIVVICVFFDENISCYFCDEALFKALGSLSLSFGTALVGVTAIIFTLIIFALQVNIERLPYGLFYSLNSDKKLMLSLGSILIIAILIASMSLIQNKTYATWILFILLEGVFAIFFLLIYVYKRALQLINPFVQLNLLTIKVEQNLHWWEARFRKAKPLITISQPKYNFDNEKYQYFQINPAYFHELQLALEYINFIAQKNIEAKDYHISLKAFETLIQVNRLYITAKSKTFFSHTNDTFWNDEVVNITLGSLRKMFSFSMKNNDENSINLILECYVELAKVYGTIEYSSSYDDKTHMGIASQHLIEDVEKLIPLNNPDLLMNSIRYIERLASYCVEHELLIDSIKMFEVIGLIGRFSALKQDDFPVVQTSMNAFSNITKKLLLSKSDISFTLEELNKEIISVTKSMLENQRVFTHEASLCGYFALSGDSLIHFFERLVQNLLEKEPFTEDEKNILDNILVYADKSYMLNKELFLFALEKQSPSINNFIFSIMHFSHLLLLLSTLAYKEKKFENEAKRYISIFSFIPKTAEALLRITVFHLIERLFEQGKIYIEKDFDVSDIIKLLTNLSFKIAEQDDQNSYQSVLGLMGASYLTLKCKEEYTDIQLFKLIEDNTKKYTMSSETIDYVCSMISNVINGEIRSYGIHNNIEKSIMECEPEKINTILKKVTNILKGKVE